jgi:hypothetical protein
MNCEKRGKRGIKRVLALGIEASVSPQPINNI